MGEAKRRKQLLGFSYGKPESEHFQIGENKILNDAGRYGLKTPPWLNKWGFTDNADSNNPPIDITAVRASMEYIEQNFDSIKTFNTDDSSYTIKHLVENRIGQYVANGELIIAMINCGFKFKQWSVSSPNCLFNVSEKSLNMAREKSTSTPDIVNFKNSSYFVPKLVGENILVTGRAGCGKSCALSKLVKQYLMLNKKVFVFGVTYSTFNIPDYFNFKSSYLTKATAKPLFSLSEFYDLPDSFYNQEKYDVIVIDDFRSLSEESRRDLLLLLKEAKTNFIFCIQTLLKEDAEIIKYFNKVYIGYYKDISQLAINLAKETESLKICTENNFVFNFLKIEPKR